MSAKRALFIAVFMVSFALLVLPTGTHLHAQTATEIQQQIDQHASQIAKIQKEIEEYQRQLQVLGTQSASLSTSIKSLDTQRKALNSKIKSLQSQISKLNLELRQLGALIDTKQEQINLSQRALAQSLRNIHMADSASIIEQVFNAKDLGDAWAEVDASITLNSALQDQTRTLATVKQELSAKKSEVSKTQEKLVLASNDLGTQKKAVDVTVSQKAQLLAQTKSQESAYQTLIAQKKAQEKAFEDAIYKLSAKLKSADTSKVPKAGKGILAWPLENIRITQSFGKTSSSGRLYASGTHNGVDFGAAIGTPVYASLGGTVKAVNVLTPAEDRKAGYCQYGNWILIEHPNGLATMYAHLSQVNVSKGESVATGQAIGYAGDTGFATGPHLHFTVYNSSSVSYTTYTCKSGAKVYIPVAPVNGYLDPMVYL